MAWYTLYKWFREFRKTPFFNYINWYRGYIYNEWFQSLDDDGRMAELHHQQEIGKKYSIEQRRLFLKLDRIYQRMDIMLDREINQYIKIAKDICKIK